MSVYFTKPVVGHILRGTAEKEVRLFRVDWFSPELVRGKMWDTGAEVTWPAMPRHAFCKAETVQGAVNLGQLCHPEGQDFVAKEVTLWI